MKTLMLLLSGLFLTVIMNFAQPALAATAAQTTIGKACDASQDQNIPGCASGSQKLDIANGSSEAYLKTLIDGFLYAAGVVAFIFVIIGGIRYITATGDSTRVQKAKNTLLYAIIGLIVTLLAVPIANFVINQVAGG